MPRLEKHLGESNCCAVQHDSEYGESLGCRRDRLGCSRRCNREQSTPQGRQVESFERQVKTTGGTVGGMRTGGDSSDAICSGLLVTRRIRFPRIGRPFLGGEWLKRGGQRTPAAPYPVGLIRAGTNRAWICWSDSAARCPAAQAGMLAGAGALSGCSGRGRWICQGLGQHPRQRC
jgi:hypothetical protein